MANSYAKKDAYAIINKVVEQAMGKSTLQAVDTTTFVAVGETLLQSLGYEKTFDAISNVVLKTKFVDRAYSGKLKIIQEDSWQWGNGWRKMSPIYKEALEKDTTNNSNSNGYELLNDGNSTDQYKINKQPLKQTNFTNVQLVQKSMTLFNQDQMNVAFSGEGEFLQFAAMIRMAWKNKLEKAFEEARRVTLNNYIGASLKLGMYVDLTEEFNLTYGTSYTLNQLLSTYFENYAKFIIAWIKKKSKLLTEYTITDHVNLEGAEFEHHTPLEDQRLVLYEPFFIDVKANVFSSLFHPEELDIGEYEGVNFWQSLDKPTAISIKPNYLDPETGKATSASSAVTCNYVLGVLFDRDAVGMVNVFNKVMTTVPNAAGDYQNTFYHGQVVPWNDQTEKGIVLILGPGGAPNSITLNKSSVSVVEAATTSLTATTVPAGATVTWASSDEDVATVAAGTVTGVAAGTCTVTASITVNAHTYTAACEITVTEE